MTDEELQKMAKEVYESSLIDDPGAPPYAPNLQSVSQRLIEISILKAFHKIKTEVQYKLITEMNAFQSAFMAKYGRNGGVTITKEKFIEIWKDQEKYEDLSQILEALGFEK